MPLVIEELFAFRSHQPAVESEQTPELVRVEDLNTLAAIRCRPASPSTVKP
jgi:hypothetical protein